jgi:hypothetical protein
MSQERFLRLLNAGYLAAHIHEAPVWIVPCPEGGTPTNTSGSSIYPVVQNMLAALKGDRDSPWRIRRVRAECAPTALEEAFCDTVGVGFV